MLRISYLFVIMYHDMQKLNITAIVALFTYFYFYMELINGIAIIGIFRLN